MADPEPETSNGFRSPPGEGANNAPQQERSGENESPKQTTDPSLKNIKTLGRLEQQDLIMNVAEGEPFLGLPDVIPAGYTGTIDDMKAIASNKENQQHRKKSEHPSLKEDEHPNYRKTKAIKALKFLKTMNEERNVSYDAIWTPRLGEDYAIGISDLTEDHKKKLEDISKIGEIKDNEHLQKSMPADVELSPNEMIEVLSSLTSDESLVAIEVLRAAIKKETIAADDPLQAIVQEDGDEEMALNGDEGAINKQGGEMERKALELLSQSLDGETIIEEIQALIPPGKTFQWEHLENICEMPWEGEYKPMAKTAKENLQHALKAMEIIEGDMATIRGYHFPHKPKTKPEGWERQPYHWEAYTAMNPHMREIIKAIIQHKGAISWYSGAAREAVQAITAFNGLLAEENKKRGQDSHLGVVQISRFVALWTARVKAERPDVSSKAESALAKLIRENHMPSNWGHEQDEKLPPANGTHVAAESSPGGFATVEIYGSEAITYTRENDVTWMNYKEGYTIAGEEIELRAKKGNAIYFVVKGPQGRRVVDRGSAGGRLAEEAAEAANIPWVPTNEQAKQDLKKLLQGGEFSIGFKWWAMNKVDLDKLSRSEKLRMPDLIGMCVIQRKGKEDLDYPAWRGAFEHAFAPKLIQGFISRSLGSAMPLPSALATEWMAKLPPDSLMAEQAARFGRGKPNQVSSLMTSLKNLYLEAPREFEKVAPDIQRLAMAANTKRLE